MSNEVGEGVKDQASRVYSSFYLRNFTEYIHSKTWRITYKAGSLGSYFVVLFCYDKWFFLNILQCYSLGI